MDYRVLSRIVAICSSLLLASPIIAAPDTSARTAPTTQAALGDVTDAFELPTGYEIRVWAKTPQLFNPTNIDVDARGRIWVAEGVNYRETIHPLHALKHPAGDRIVILQDTDGDGVCDSSKVFVQDKDLVTPLGIAVLGNKVFVSCSPNVILYTDTDGDDHADTKQILLSGFGGHDNDHGVHAITGFLDGRLYFTVGNQGPHDVTDKSGWTFLGGSCYGGPPNIPNRKSDDERVWTGGVAFRMNDDGTHFRPFAFNFRNSYEIALDSFGNVWQTDNDDDGNRSVRTSWVMEGGNYGYASADGTRSWQTDRRPGQTTQIAHWHQDDPGVMPSGDIMGAGGPTGIVACEGGMLGEKYRGCLLDADALRQCVYVHKPIAQGAGFKLERQLLLQAKPDSANPYARWFRPSDIAIGTDGALYIADWWDPMVGGHDMHDKQGLGRILRVAPKGDHTRPPRIDLTSLDGQIAALASPAVNVRYAAAMKLRAAGDAAVPRLQALLASHDPVMAARAIWLLAQTGRSGREILRETIESNDATMRLVSFRAMRAAASTSDERREVLSRALHLADDSSPAVRREVAVAVRDVPLGRCRDVLFKLAEKCNPNDRFSVEAFGVACQGKEEAIYPLLVREMGDEDPLKWSQAMATLVWRLHPQAAIDALSTRAAAGSLSAEARKQAIDALAFIRSERAAVAMDHLAQSGPADVRPQAAWWLKFRASNEWRDFAAVQRQVAIASTRPDRAAEEKRKSDLKLILNTRASIKRRYAAAARLASERNGEMMLISLAEDGKFPSELTEVVLDPINHSPDFGIRALASQYFPRKAAGGKALPPIKQLASMHGDVARGRAVFFGNIAGCARCHSFDGQGKDVGPDLTAIRTKYPRLELLDNILNPSANIAFGYEPWIIKTRDGEVYSGFIRADGETVTLKESTGEVRTLGAKDIKLRKRQPFSVMPDNVALGLSAQDLADLAEFLLKSPTNPSPSSKPTAAAAAK